MLSRRAPACATLTIPFAVALALGACGDPSGDDDDDVTDDASVTDGSPQPQADALEATCTPASGTDVTTEVVASGIPSPVFLTSPPGDARLFVLEQRGRIRIIQNDNLVDEPFLDISALGDNERVRDTSNEQGLLGLAFHPEYGTNGRFFVNYTAQPDGRTVIAEYTASSDPNVANTAERRILEIDQPYGNHNGGMIAFGPDGNLYVGMGDGGSANDPQENGQDTSTQLGAMLRIDVDNGEPYGIPSDNPFANGGGAAEIYAIGVRNPWRYSFDRETGDLYIGDVGQDAVEEVSVTAAGGGLGANFGWDITEGDDCFEPDPMPNCDTFEYVAPAVTHRQNNSGFCSVTGGYVYRGSCIPDLQGTYLYADFCADEVWSFRWSGGTVSDHQRVSGTFGSAITSFGEDALGELYILNRGGQIRRIVPAN